MVKTFLNEKILPLVKSSKVDYKLTKTLFKKLALSLC